MRIAMLVALVLVAANAVAQPRMRMVVEETDDDAVRCGITKAKIEASISQNLGRHGIGIFSAPTGNPYFYAATTVLRPANTNNLCVIYTHVSVRGYSSSDSRHEPLGGFTSKVSSTTHLCEQGWIQSAGEARLHAAWMPHMDEKIKLCLGEMKW